MLISSELIKLLIIFGCKVIDHIWMLDKLAYVQNIIDGTDKVAHRELKALVNHERGLLNASVLDALFRYSQDVIWVYRGNEFHIDSKTSFNKFLSRICDEVYFSTPIYMFISLHPYTSMRW